MGSSPSPGSRKTPAACQWRLTTHVGIVSFRAVFRCILCPAVNMPCRERGTESDRKNSSYFSIENVATLFLGPFVYTANYQAMSLFTGIYYFYHGDHFSIIWWYGFPQLLLCIYVLINMSRKPLLFVTFYTCCPNAFSCHTNVSTCLGNISSEIIVVQMAYVLFPVLSPDFMFAELSVTRICRYPNDWCADCWLHVSLSNQMSCAQCFLTPW